MNNLIKKISNPYILLLFILNKTRLSYLLPDELYLKLLFRRVMGQNLNLKNPQTFNEKLNWLKLYDRKPEYSKMVDKYEAKKYVASIIGEEYIIPTYGVWEKFDDIDFDVLPDKFVLKCTHDSGSIIFCFDKNNFDYVSAKKKITKALKQNAYLPGREWAYKHVKPRIIAEELIVDNSKGGLKDYKFFCFNSNPKLIQVDFNRFKNHKRNLYTTDWVFIDAQIHYLNDKNVQIDKPKQLDTMLNLSSKLSYNIPQIRVDLYTIEERIYFGELTLYHGSGQEIFNPESLNKEMGEYIQLPNLK